MPVVPFSPNRGAASPPSPRPPDDTYLLMAAAQMHKEGRLIQSTPDEAQGKDIPGVTPMPKADDPDWLNKFERHQREYQQWFDNQKQELRKGNPKGFEEWQSQSPNMQEQPNEPDNPQMKDIDRLFHSRIRAQQPPSQRI